MAVTEIKLKTDSQFYAKIMGFLATRKKKNQMIQRNLNNVLLQSFKMQPMQLEQNFLKKNIQCLKISLLKVLLHSCLIETLKCSIKKI